jgi:hypothetical protein
MPISRARPVALHEHQVGDVGAGDEQDQHHRAEQHQHPAAHLADQVLVQRHHVGAAARRPFRILLFELLRQPPHLLRRLVERHAVLQPADDGVVEVVAVPLGAIVLAQHQRHEQLGRPFAPHRVREGLRHHADDLVGGLAQVDRLADDVVRAAEPALPEAVGENRHAVLAFDFVGRVERPPEQGRDAQDGKEFERDPLRPCIRGFSPFGLQPELRAGNRRDLLEGLLQLAEVEVGLRRDVAEPERRLALDVPFVDDAQTVVLVERQAAQHHRVDHGKDRRARADAERQHDERHHREGTGVAEGADRISDVVAHGGLDVDRGIRVGAKGRPDLRSSLTP